MRVRSAVRRLCKGTSPFARHSPFSFLQSFLFFSLLFSSLYSLSFLFLRACSTFFYFLTFFLFSLNPFLTPWFPFHVHPFPILFLPATDCRVVKRRKRLFVTCKRNPRHKQRQGFHTSTTVNTSPFSELLPSTTLPNLSLATPLTNQAVLQEFGAFNYLSAFR